MTGITARAAEPQLGAAGSRSLSAQDRAALEAERDFLLASIRDLQAEHEAGELTDAQYETLASGYTARAARVLRALEAPPAPTAPPDRATPGVWRRRLVVLAPLAAVVTVGAVLLPSALSGRQPGQTITGNQQSEQDARATLAGAVAARPDDPAARRAYARFLLEEDDVVEALEQYDAAARLDPTDAESRAYAGWIVFLAGLTDDALARIDGAIAADPTNPDAHFFRGTILARGRQDGAGALAELRRFLELAPDTPMRDAVEQLIAELEATSPSSQPAAPGDTGS